MILVPRTGIEPVRPFRKPRILSLMKPFSGFLSHSTNLETIQKVRSAFSTLPLKLKNTLFTVPVSRVSANG